MPPCKLITSEGAVLILIAHHNHITVREIAHTLGLTERLIHGIITRLVAEGYLSKRRVGRGNRYQVHLDRPLGQSALQGMTLGELLRGVQAAPRGQTEVLTQLSRNAGGETEQRPHGWPPEVTEATLPEHRLYRERLLTQTRDLREGPRKVRETSRRMRAERAVSKALRLRTGRAAGLMDEPSKAG
jgi:DNA-binding MarR family transcriptional regulator